MNLREPFLTPQAKDEIELIRNCVLAKEDGFVDRSVGDAVKEFAKEVAAFLNNANKDILVRVKIVYNDNNYTTLPRYTKYTFIEPMILPEGETSSIVELSIDKFTKSVVEDRETTVTNPLEPSSASVTDNLPF